MTHNILQKELVSNPVATLARTLLTRAGYAFASSFVGLPTRSQGPRDLIACALRNAGGDYFEAVSIASRLTRS